MVEHGMPTIYVGASDGSNLIKLTDNTIRNWFPVWSPDSSYIADPLMGLSFTWSQTGPLETLFHLAIIIPSLALGARRLRDINRTGWWQLMWLGLLVSIPVGLSTGRWELSGVGFIPVIVLIVWAIKRGDCGPNKYDPDSRQAYLTTAL